MGVEKKSKLLKHLTYTFVMGVVMKMYVKNKIFVVTKFLNLKLFNYFYKSHHDIYVINILIRM